MRTFIHLLWVVLLVNGPASGYAQEVPAGIIKEGLEKNLVLLERNVSLEKSLLAVKQARSLFLPTSWVEGQYTLARGGRSIDIPVGDLVNPVYKTLNQLTGTNGFPQVENVSEQLLANNFYDLRLKTVMPLINPDLKVNRAIREQQTTLAQNEIDIYKRELVKEIKTAYYNILLSRNAVLIYRNAMEVVTQNLKVNQSLLNNGRGLYAYVSRAEAEVKQVESQLQNAINQQYNANAYLNFLLNRPLADSIAVPAPDAVLMKAQLPPVIAEGVRNREELLGLNTALRINTLTEKMNRSFRIPRLNAFVDLASQGFNFKVDNRSLFYLAGLQLQVPVFTGRRNLITLAQTRLEGKSLALKKDHLEQQLELSALVSRNNTVTAYNTYLASVKQQEAAQQYFKLIDKGFREGVNPLIEFLDARNQMTNAQIQMNISHYKVLTALADYERQTSSYLFK